MTIGAVLIAGLAAAGGQLSAGTIKGDVRDSTCGAVIPGVMLTVRGESGESRAYTDKYGRFEFSGLRDGDYSLHAEIPGFWQFTHERLKPPAELRIALPEAVVTPLSLCTGDPSSCRVVPPPDPQPTFSIAVQSANCGTLAGARVTLRTGNNELSARADRNGRVTPITPPPGEYEISVEHPDFVTLLLRHVQVPLVWRGPMILTLQRGNSASRDVLDPPRTVSANQTRGTVPDPRTSQKVVVVAMGDSTTAGTPGWTSPREAPPKGRGDETSQYAYWLMKAHPEWDVRNMGVNGERSDQIRARFEQDVVAQHPAVVVIVAGVNDVYQGRPASHAIAQLKAMYERAREAGIKVIAGSIVPYNTASIAQNGAMRTINNWIREHVAGDPNARFVDTRAAAAAPADPDRLASSPDGLHPDAAGYRRMADAIRPVIEGVLGGTR